MYSAPDQSSWLGGSRLPELCCPEVFCDSCTFLSNREEFCAPFVLPNESEEKLATEDSGFRYVGMTDYHSVRDKASKLDE